MKKISTLVLGISMAIISCQDNKEIRTTTDTGTVESNETIETPKPVVSDAVCYAQMNANDTINMRLNISGSSVTGELNYMLKEKDSNKGTINGTINNDTLIADYTFNSEGTSSVRQVAFLIKDGKATEGYGDLEEKNGQLVFKDKANISFGKGVVMNKTDCK